MARSSDGGGPGSRGYTRSSKTKTDGGGSSTWPGYGMTDEQEAEAAAQMDTSKAPKYYGGVDEDYVVQVPYHGRGPYRVQPTAGPNYGLGPESVDRYGSYARPLYKDGDWQSILGNMQPMQMERLQQSMESAGLLRRGSYTLGMPDPGTVSAFEDILAMANLQGKSWESVAFGSGISRRRGGGGGGGGGGRARAPLTTQVTNASTLRRLFRETAVQATGSKVEGLDIDAMVKAYQDIERGYQKEAYAKAETGGEIETPMGPDEFAQDKLETDYRAETGANTLIERAGGLLRQLANGGI